MTFLLEKCDISFLGTFLRQIERDGQDPAIILDVEDEDFEEISENGSTGESQSENDLDESWTGLLGKILVNLVIEWP